MYNLKKIILYDLFSGGRNLNPTGRKVKRLLLLDRSVGSLPRLFYKHYREKEERIGMKEEEKNIKE